MMVEEIFRALAVFTVIFAFVYIFRLESMSVKKELLYAEKFDSIEAVKLSSKGKLTKEQKKRSRPSFTNNPNFPNEDFTKYFAEIVSEISDSARKGDTRAYIELDTVHRAGSMMKNELIKRGFSVTDYPSKRALIQW